ncbi:MAG TPA: DUF2231 domain-containing protein [Terracidiphilus sp.]|nr:DUF2231 domain-containing protein [Terracidiphilus sp.]
MHIPSMPSWESLHPLVIHFPIVLLLLSPMFVLVSALLSPLRSRPYMIVGLVLLTAGTASLWLAAETGEAAAEIADRTQEINAVILAHEHLASQTRLIFSALTLVLGGIFVLPHFLRRPVTRVHSTILPLVFVAIYSLGAVALVNTAHEGGRLVHQFGVHAMMPAQNTVPDRISEKGAE